MKNRAWKYCRQACPDELLTGIARQDMIMNRYIAEHDLVLAGETKVVEAGTSADRESICELIRLAEEGAYDILLILDLDRLAREMFACMEICRKLLNIGVRIIPINSGMEFTLDMLEPYTSVKLLMDTDRSAPSHPEYGAVCDICNQKQLEADGCKVSFVSINEEEYDRIPYGKEHGAWTVPDENDRCPDCGALYGHYHHWNCDIEECPVCHGQLFSCDCQDVECKVVK